MGLTLLLAGLVLLLNAFASVVVLRVPVFSPSQRLLQIALIWLVPIIGAVICATFAYSLGPASPGTMDPLYLPSDGGGPEGSGAGIWGCSGSDAGAGSGGDGE